MLPGGEDGPGGPSGGDSTGFGNGVFGMGPGGFGYLPATGHTTTGPDRGGFRIHEVDRSASRGRRRFAFAAAGAVSAAAFALSGAPPLDVTVGGPGAGGPRAASSPPRTAPAPGRTGNGAVTSPSASAARSRSQVPTAAPGFLGNEIEATSWSSAPVVPGSVLPGLPPGNGPSPAATAGTGPPPFPFAGSRPVQGDQGVQAAGESSAMSSAGAGQPDGQPAPFGGTSTPAPSSSTGR